MFTQFTDGLKTIVSTILFNYWYRLKKINCLVLNKNLEIIYISTTAKNKIKLFTPLIKSVIHNFDANNLIHKRFNYFSPAAVCKNNALSINIHGHYRNKFIYNNIELNYDAKPIALFGYNLFILVKLSFQKNSTHVTNKAHNVTTPETRLIEDLKIKLINLMINEDKTTQDEERKYEYINLYNNLDSMVKNHPAKLN